MSSVTEPSASIDHALVHANRLLAEDPALAIEQVGEILKVAPGHPMALLLLAVARRALGELDEAIRLLSALVAARPQWASAQYEAGLSLGRAGRSREAVAALRRVVELDPAFPQAWRALGDQLAAAGESGQAAECYLQHVRHSTRDPRLLAAAAALQAQRLPEAEALLKKQLAAAPTDVAAIRMLAELAVRVGRHQEAERLLERCLELAPGFREARHNYALVLHRDNRPEAALAELQHLFADDPDHAGARALQAAILCRIGDVEEGIALYERLLVEYPRQPKAWLSYGHALKTAGRQAESIEAYRRAIALDPAFGEAYWSLANLKTFRFAADELDAMRAQLRRDDLGEENRLHFEFALGKACEDAGDYGESFRHYREGNALRLRQVPYDAAHTSRRVAAAKRVCDREFFEGRAGWGDPAPDPIFIVGLPRAGSTLIEQILSSHSQVEGTQELPEVIALAQSLRRDGADGGAVGYHEALARLDAGRAGELGRRYLEATRIQRKTAAPLFIDKMPNNFLHLALIQLALPNARIIDARRHPLACCFSGFKQHFARGQPFTYSLDDIGRYYADYVELMAHYDAVLPGRVHRVHYEDMVADTETEVRRLLDYCGLPFEDGCLRFFENERPVRTASSEQVRQPIYREGVEHWRHFEPWLEPLKQALGEVLDAYPWVPDYVAKAADRR